jgi:hypothetical protein
MVGCTQIWHKRLEQCKRLLQVRFGTENESIMPKYSGLSCPIDHVTKCTCSGDQYLNKNGLIYLCILWTLLKNWYIELEVHRGTRDWEELTRNSR